MSVCVLVCVCIYEFVIVCVCVCVCVCVFVCVCESEFVFGLCMCFFLSLVHFFFDKPGSRSEMRSLVEAARGSRFLQHQKAHTHSPHVCSSRMASEHIWKIACF